MLKIYFGDKTDPFCPGKYLESREAFDALREQLGAESLAFLNQVHGTEGVCVQRGRTFSAARPEGPAKLCEDGRLEGSTVGRWRLNLFQSAGDYLITNEPGCAIGVLTADCLPIVLHDEKNNACAVIHAGWRGSVAGIAGKALEAMENSFGTRARDVVAHFGPSAKVCCYEVGEDFAENVCKFLVCRSSRVICEANCIERNDGVFFDNVRLNEFQLFEAGVLADNINKTENKCTICDNSYHSYRRDKGEAGRQATVVLVSFSKG